MIISILSEHLIGVITSDIIKRIFIMDYDIKNDNMLHLSNDDAHFSLKLIILVCKLPRQLL